MHTTARNVEIAGTAGLGPDSDGDVEEELNLDGNALGGDSCAAIREALGSNVSLLTLGLSQCAIAPQGAAVRAAHASTLARVAPQELPRYSRADMPRTTS